MIIIVENVLICVEYYQISVLEIKSWKYNNTVT